MAGLSHSIQSLFAFAHYCGHAILFSFWVSFFSDLKPGPFFRNLRTRRHRPQWWGLNRTGGEKKVLRMRNQRTAIWRNMYLLTDRSGVVRRHRLELKGANDSNKIHSKDFCSDPISKLFIHTVKAETEPMGFGAKVGSVWEQEGLWLVS